MIKKWFNRFNLWDNPYFHAIHLLIIVIIALISFSLIFIFGQGLIASYEILKTNYIELLQPIVTLLWLYVFTLISITPLAVFSALYVYFFASKTSKFFELMNFFQSLPEFLLAIFAFSIFSIFLNINGNSILLYGLLLFLVVFPLIFFIVLEALNGLNNNYKILFHDVQNKIKFLIFEVLPKISSHIIFYILKVLLFINSIGFAFFAFNNVNYNLKIPVGFSDSGASLVQKFYLNIVNINVNNHLFISIIFFLLLINIIFIYLEFLIKKLFLTKIQF